MIDFNNTEKLFPKRPRSHRIDAKASKILKNVVPENWIFNEIKDDYGIDYHVEISFDDSPQGLNFYIQQKGVEECEFGSDEKYHLTIKQSTLNYWIVSPLPVLIVVVDVELERVFCSWIEDAYSNYPTLVAGQDYKTIHIEQKDLSTGAVQKDILEVLTSNRDSKLKKETLASEISETSGISKSEVMEIISKSPNIGSIVELCKRIDSNFTYDVVSNDNGLSIIVKPKGNEQIAIAKIVNPTHETKTKIERLLDYGESINLSPEEITMMEPKSLKLLFPGYDVKEVIVQKNTARHLSQVIMHGESKCKTKICSTVFNMETVRMGLKEVTLKLWLTDFPVTFIIKFNPDINVNAEPTIDYSVDMSSCSLEANLKALKLLDILDNGGYVSAKLASNDKQLFKVYSISADSRFNYDKSIELVEVLITINNTFNSNIHYPELSYDEETRISLHNLSFAYQVAKQGYYRMPIDDRLTVNIQQDKLRIIAETDWNNENSVIQYAIPDYRLGIFGEIVSMGKCSVKLHGFQPELCKEDMLKIAEELPVNEFADIIFVYKGNDDEPIALHEFSFSPIG